MIELLEQELPNRGSQLILTIRKRFRELLDQGMNARLELRPVPAMPGTWLPAAVTWPMH